MMSCTRATLLRMMFGCLFIALLLYQAAQCVSFTSAVLQAPEEAQREFVGQKHGGAHREASDSVY